MPRPHSELAAFPLSALALALCLVLPCACAYGAPFRGGPSKHLGKKDAREQINELEQQWRAATMAGDVSALDKLLAEDYVGISWTGQVNTKVSQLDRLRNKTLVITKMDVTEMKVKVVGPVAIVTSRSDIQGSNDGVELKGAFVYTRIYQRTPAGQWRITNFEATRIPPGGRNNNRHNGAPAAEEHP